MPAKTVKNSAAEPDTRRFWNCPACGVWAQTDSDGNVGDHFRTHGSCPGSGEATAFRGSAVSEEGQDALPGRVVELAKSVVRALQPGARYRCESEDELRDRLAHAGVDFDPDNFAVALEMLEQTVWVPLDTGGLPGLPYRVLRPESRYPRTKDNPHPPRPIVLQELRSL